MATLAGMRIFSRVVEAGSFSEAGRQLDMAPSSVSRQISDLEDALGVQLFQRTTRKLNLTEAGQLYSERATQILTDIDEARLAVSQLDGTPTGILRLSVPATLSRRHIVPMLAQFQRRYSTVQVVLSVSDQPVDLISAGQDLALRIGQLSDSSLVARKIASGPRVLCASPDYIQRQGSPNNPGELAEHNCLTFRSHPGSNLWRFQADKGAANKRKVSEVRVSGSLFADDGESLSSAAVAGLGIVLLPVWLVCHELRSGLLQEILPNFRAVPAESPLYALYPRQRHVPPKVRVFIDFMVSTFNDRLEISH